MKGKKQKERDFRKGDNVENVGRIKYGLEPVSGLAGWPKCPTES
jgi:hypothetical protein